MASSESESEFFTGDTSNDIHSPGNVILEVFTHKTIDSLPWELTLSESFCLPSEKGSTIKGKNLLPMGADSFLLE